MLDGLRICFNEYLFRLLLINENEQAQYYEALKMNLEPPVNNTPTQYDKIIILIFFFLLTYYSTILETVSNKSTIIEIITYQMAKKKETIYTIMLKVKI